MLKKYFQITKKLKKWPKGAPENVDILMCSKSQLHANANANSVNVISIAIY